MNKLRNFSILVIFLFFIFEILSYLIFKINILSISHKPKIYLPSNEIPNDEWWTEESEWGAWHKNNSETRQIRSCYNALYSSNEIGARDTSFINNNDNDIILIGDSFAEGYGVNLHQTSQYFIEKFTNQNVLNFGISNNFGFVQYYLIYNKLAKNYKHSKLIIYFLPSNDFGENDYSNWRGSKRYRPYFKEISENQFQVFIPDDAIKNYRSNTKKIKKIFKDYFWTSGLFINLNYNYKIYRSLKKYGKDTFSGYFDAKLYQQKAALYFINKIINESKVDIYLVSIPRIQDFNRLSQGENLDEVFWIKSLNKLSKTNEKFTFIDLINYKPSNLDDIYLKCDGHWNEKGNKWAAEIISKEILNN